MVASEDGWTHAPPMKNRSACCSEAAVSFAKVIDNPSHVPDTGVGQNLGDRPYDRHRALLRLIATTTNPCFFRRMAPVERGPTRTPVVEPVRIDGATPRWHVGGDLCSDHVITA